jgi:hypothetical protein
VDLGNGYVLDKNNSASLYGWRNYGDYGITSTDDEPYPTYHVFRLLSHFAGPSDMVIDARSQSSLLAAYATRRVDGRLSLMLINKSPDQEIAAQVAIAGFTPSSSAVVYTYGKAQDEAARTLNGSPGHRSDGIPGRVGELQLHGTGIFGCGHFVASKL